MIETSNSNDPKRQFARVFDTAGGQLLVTLEYDKMLRTHMLLRMQDVKGADLYFRYVVEGTEADTLSFFQNLSDEQASRMAGVVMTNGYGLGAVD